MSAYYNVRNAKQTNYAGVLNPRSAATVCGYSAASSGIEFNTMVRVTKDSHEIVIRMDTYTFVPNEPGRLGYANIVLTDKDDLKDYTWKTRSVPSLHNAYQIYRTDKDVDYLWTLEDSQNGTNIKLLPQLSDKDSVQKQYWIFEVASFVAAK